MLHYFCKMLVSVLSKFYLLILMSSVKNMVLNLSQSLLHVKLPWLPHI